MSDNQLKKASEILSKMEKLNDVYIKKKCNNKQRCLTRENNKSNKWKTQELEIFQDRSLVLNKSKGIIEKRNTIEECREFIKSNLPYEDGLIIASLVDSIYWH